MSLRDTIRGSQFIFWLKEMTFHRVETGTGGKLPRLQRFANLFTVSFSERFLSGRQGLCGSFIKILRDNVLTFPAPSYPPPVMPHWSQPAVELGRGCMHFSCVWLLSLVALRAAICCDPGVPSNQRPAQPQPLHTLYVKSYAAEHQLTMADKDRQSSASFSQCAAGGVMARVVTLCRERCRCERSFLDLIFFFLCVCKQLDVCMPNLTSRRLHTYRSLFF